MPDRLDVVMAERQVLVELQHPLRRVVHELKPSLRIDDDDAFDHAGENRCHARAVARLLGQLLRDGLHGLVQRARHGAKLVLAVVNARRRQIAFAIPFRDGSHRLDTLTDA